MQVVYENQCLFHGMVSSRVDRTEFSSWHAPLFEPKLSCHKHAGVPCFRLEFACCHFWTDSICSKSERVSVLTCVWTLERKPLKGKKQLPTILLDSLTRLRLLFLGSDLCKISKRLSSLRLQALGLVIHIKSNVASKTRHCAWEIRKDPGWGLLLSAPMLCLRVMWLRNLSYEKLCDFSGLVSWLKAVRWWFTGLMQGMVRKSMLLRQNSGRFVKETLI